MSICNTVHNELSKPDDEDECVICLESFRQVKRLSCMHGFCEVPCLQTLLNSSQGITFKCPLCRQEYFVETLACVGQGEVTVHPMTQHFRNTFIPQQSNSDIYKRITPASRYLWADSRRAAESDTVHPNRHTVADLLWLMLSTFDGSTCVKRLFYFMLIVGMVHYVLVGLGRILAGVIVCENSLKQGSRNTQFSAAVFQMAKGVIDLLIASAISCERGRRKVCLAVLVVCSFICLIVGSIRMWRSACGNKVDDCDKTFVLFSRCYSIFDWVMFVYLIVIGCSFGGDWNT